jgi:sn-glycerol 3-phosphate transport system substrate-binding protein
MKNIWQTLVTAFAAVALGAAAQEITFYYPIAVGGPITKIVDQMAADFEKENPGIKVKPVYTGTYQETIVKALTAHKSGNPPATAILLSTDMFTLIDEDAIVPFNDLECRRRGVDEELHPAFMANSQTGGGLGIPPALDHRALLEQGAFKEAGLDPNKAPQSWMRCSPTRRSSISAMRRVCHAVGRADSVKVSRIGSSSLTTPNGVELMNSAGTETYFDKPEVVQALGFWVDLGRKHKVMPTGVIEWGTTPKDFFEKKIAMMWTTTGNLTNVKNNAKFDFGVAMLPAAKRRGSPTGGGNFYVFKKAAKDQQLAAVKFAKWMTHPSAPRNGASTPATLPFARTRANREDAGIREGLPGCGGRA